MDIFTRFNRKSIDDRQVDTLIGLSKGILAGGSGELVDGEIDWECFFSSDRAWVDERISRSWGERRTQAFFIVSLSAVPYASRLVGYLMSFCWQFFLARVREIGAAFRGD